MGLFDDINRFLESRLEEFLKNNPHLELQALDEQLGEQEVGSRRLISDLQQQEKQVQDEILTIAQDIQRWHERINKAKAANRQDLVQAAQEREAALLRQGNQRWGQMQGLKERITKTQELQRQIQQRRQEVKTKAAEVAKTRTTAPKTETKTQTQTSGWNQSRTYSVGGADPLEDKFQRWEMDDELNELKRNLGK